MADEPQTPDTDENELLLTEEVEQEAPAASDEDEGDEEEVLTFGDSAEEEQDTDNATIRHLRTQVKKANKELAELRRAIPAPQAIEVGPEPDLWDEGIDGDTDKLKAALREHDRQVAAAESQRNSGQEAADAQRKAWEARLTKVAEEKAALGKDDADEAFETVKLALGEEKFAALIYATDEGNVGKLVYALASHPQQLEALASQNDYVRLVKDVAKLEGQLKMVKRRAPAPDTPERGSGKISTAPGGAAKQLAKLKAEAEESGNYDKYFDFKRKMEAK